MNNTENTNNKKEQKKIGRLEEIWNLPSDAKIIGFVLFIFLLIVWIFFVPEDLIESFDDDYD